MSLSQADLEVARVRARRRLVGMAVLVGAGVIGFPWLFETQPRPMASDIAVVQQGASAPTGNSAALKPGVQAQVKSVTKPQAAPNEPKEEFIDEPPKVASAVSSVKPAAVKSSASAPVKSAVPADKTPSAAVLRYVVQIGAFSDVPSAHEVRMKAEKVGLKTYTQVIGSDANKKIRVRLGPFEDKAAADKAITVLRRAGLSGALLTL